MLCVAQVWGNLISFLVLVPEQPKDINGAIRNSSFKYDKCGADFSEQEYDSLIPIPTVNRTTVDIDCNMINSVYKTDHIFQG